MWPCVVLRAVYSDAEVGWGYFGADWSGVALQHTSGKDDWHSNSSAVCCRPQWRRKQFESEGQNLPARGAGENFGDVPLHFYQNDHLILIYFGVNGLRGKSGGHRYRLDPPFRKWGSRDPPDPPVVGANADTRSIVIVYSARARLVALAL